MKRYKAKKDLKIPLPKEDINKEDMEKELNNQYTLRNKRLDILFKKQKKLLSKGYNLANFKEPVLQLIRRDKSVEFYENVTPGEYRFRHSDSSVGDIICNLSEASLLRFPYGNKQFRGFLHHEDEFLPYPHNILLSAESVRILVDKTLNDLKTWKAKELRARGDLWWKMGMAIAVVILAYAMYKIIVPQGPDPVAKIVQQTNPGDIINKATETVKNITVVVKNVTGG